MKYTVQCLLHTVIIFLAACAPHGDQGVALRLNFEQMAPLSLQVAAVEIVDQHRSPAGDFSSLFPMPPHEALRRYAGSRLKAAGGQDSLKFVIEKASAQKHPVESDSQIGQWLGMGRSDRYTIAARIHVYTVSPGGMESPHATFNFEKARNIPQSLSIAGRERELLGFLEELIGDVDKAVTSVLQDRMLTVYAPGSGDITSFPDAVRLIHTEELPVASGAQ